MKTEKKDDKDNETITITRGTETSPTWARLGTETGPTRARLGTKMGPTRH